MPSPSTYTLCISTPATIVNTNCVNMRPACSNNTIVFQAQTGGTAPVGNNYGCLATQPNPSWFYMQIGTPGTLTFTLGASADIDFAVWGPYTTLSNAVTACGTLPAPVACSYATAKLETVNITGATTGQVYILLVTNYANVNQIIDIRQTGGTGTSDCSIVLSSDLNKLTAQAIGKNNVVSWEVPPNNSHIKGFEIQKSLNGRNFNLLTSIEHNQNSSYTFSEESPLCKDAYYQIITTYQDGRKSPSYVVSVLRRQGDCQHLVQVYPNPAQKNLTIQLLQNVQSPSAYMLTDTKGKNYLAGKIPKETEKYDLDLAEIPKGLYILKVKIENQWIYEKVVKE